MIDRNEDVLRNELIGHTVAEAAELSDFYRELYSDVDIGRIESIGDLARLPVVDKNAIRAAREDALCKGKTCSYVQNTSGSTGDLLVMFRSREEADFIREFFARVHASHTPETRPIVLSLATPSHGTPTSIPCTQFVLSHAIIDDETAQQTVRLLERRYRIPGVDERASVISGALSQILVLTEYLMERNLRGDRFAIRFIVCTGRYVTRRFRQVLEEFWGAMVIDRYSLSEVFGGATYCSLCDGYHFDPYVVPEVLDLKNCSVMEEGVGALALTALSPFVQLHPFIRYWTGDLFRLVPNGCTSRSYKFLGRLKHALIDPDAPDRILLNGVDVWEVLDQYPEIQRTRKSQTLTNLHVPIARGELRRYEEMRIAELMVELSFNPQLYPRHQRRMVEEIREKLLACSETLADDVKTGRMNFNVKLVAPGTLQALELQPFEKKTSLWELL